MAKKIKGPIILKLISERVRLSTDPKNRSQDELFCRAWEKQSKECAFGIEVIADSRYYNLLYQNGIFMGLVNGTVYPFSYDYTKKGSRFRNRKIKHAEVVCISKSQNLEMFWGTPSRLLVYDKDRKPYRFGANGSFFVEIEPTDHAKNADMLYRKLLLTADEEGMTVMDVKNKLQAAYVNRIGAIIQRTLEDLDFPLKDLVGLQASEMLEISEKVYRDIKDLFLDFGLTVTPASTGSIIRYFMINEEGKKEIPAAPVHPSPASFF